MRRHRCDRNSAICTELQVLNIAGKNDSKKQGDVQEMAGLVMEEEAMSWSGQISECGNDTADA